MRVSSLIISGDSQVQRCVKDTFVETDLHLCENTLAAFELIGRSHFDAFIIDCDNLDRGSEIIAAVRKSKSNRKSVLFTIVNGRTALATAMELGSNFVLQKPVNCDELATYFESSRQKMEAEHRRYFRYQLSIDATVIRRDGKVIPVQILNVSDAGLAFRLLDEGQVRGSVTIGFHVPNEQPTPVTAVAVICWSRGPLYGVKFLGMEEESRKAYAEWLSSMALA